MNTERGLSGAHRAVDVAIIGSRLTSVALLVDRADGAVGRVIAVEVYHVHACLSMCAFP